jgi:hypothetical protein
MVVEMMNSLQLDPINRANVADFVTSVVNNRKETFGIALDFEREELEAYEPPIAEPGDTEKNDKQLRVVK